MTRHGSPGHPATTPGFCIYITVDFARAYGQTPLGGLLNRRATVDALIDLVTLCEGRGWELEATVAGGRRSVPRSLYMVRGDLVDHRTIIPAVAAAVRGLAEMRVAGHYPTTKDEEAELKEFAKAHGILALHAF